MAYEINTQEDCDISQLAVEAFERDRTKMQGKASAYTLDLLNREIFKRLQHIAEYKGIIKLG